MFILQSGGGGGGGGNFCKKNCVTQCHLVLKLVCVLSPDCFYRLSSNFILSLILLIIGTLLILDKTGQKNMATRGDFVKCNAKYHKACSKCFKNVPIMFFPHVLTPDRTLFLPFEVGCCYICSHLHIFLLQDSYW